jgi:glycosyltransferase involved in cell wall biosynthesis
VARRDAEGLADAIVDLMDHPAERARLSAAARATSQRFDIAAFDRKMERLYVLLHNARRAGRRGIPQADLAFLSEA